MSARIPTVSLILVALGALLSFSIQRTEQRNTLQAMQAWASAHAYWSNRDPSEEPPSPYWRWRAPIRQGQLQALGQAVPYDFLVQMGAGQEVWAINEAAQHPVYQIPAAALPLISLSTASFLGLKLPDRPEAFDMLSRQVVGGLKPWRQQLQDLCDSCAPAARPFPAPLTHLIAGSEGLGARGATGISIGVEQHRRTASPIMEQPSPIVAMVKRIRNGGQPTNEEWNTPGLAGMAALELSLSGDPSLADTFLWLARNGPSRTDRIAGLWAAKQVGASDPMLTQIESGTL